MNKPHRPSWRAQPWLPVLPGMRRSRPALHASHRLRATERLFVIAAGIVLGAAALGGSWWLASAESTQALATAQARSAQVAAILQAQTARSTTALDAALQASAQQIAGAPARGFAASARVELDALQRAHPAVRATLIVDADGEVLAASPRPLEDTRWPRGALGTLPSPGLGSIGALQPANGPASKGTPLLPLMRQLSARDGTNLWIVALLEPSELLAGSSVLGRGGSAILFDMAGRIVAASENAPWSAGSVQPGLPAIAQLERERETGQFRQVVQGAAPGSAATAYQVHFHAVRGWPLGLSVFTPEQPVLDAVSLRAGTLRTGGAVAALVILLVTLVVLRTLAARDRGSAELARARDAAQRANDAKSAFLANMSHEIRTPISSMVGMTDLALATALNPTQREYLTLARTSSQMLLRLIDDILDFSRAESGQIELSISEFDLHELCQLQLKNFSLQASRKDIELMLDIAADVPLRVRGDPVRIGQVLLNLIGNAVKFTPSGWVRLALRRSGTGQLQFEVHDSGIGIAAHQQRAIFESFSQADTSVTRAHGGNGLGLTICHRLVRLMGGTINVRSKPGEGSTFRFTCDLQACENAPEDEVLLPNAVLVYDTDELTRELMCTLLRSMEIKPLAVTSHTELRVAMERCRAAHTHTPLLLDARELDERTRALIGEGTRQWMTQVIVAHAIADLPRLAEFMTELPDCKALAKPVIRREVARCFAGEEFTAPAPLAEMPEPTPVASDVPGSMRVLLVEDTPLNQRLAMMVLGSMGVAVDLAENGLEGVRMRKSGHYDLVLMDLQMPYLDGVQATIQIRAWERDSHQRRVPIVAMTAHGLDKDRAECLAAGMDDFLPKPVSLSDFSRVVNACRPEGSAVRAPALASASDAVPARGAEIVSPLPAAASRDARQVIPSGITLPPGGLLDMKRALDFVGDESAVRNMLPALQTSLLRDIPEIERLLLAGDVRGANRLLHPLKGFMPIFCTDAVIDEVTELEIQSKSAKAVEVLVAFDRLRPLLDRLTREVTRAVAQESPDPELAALVRRPRPVAAPAASGAPAQTGELEMQLHTIS